MNRKVFILIILSICCLQTLDIFAYSNTGNEGVSMVEADVSNNEVPVENDTSSEEPDVNTYVDNNEEPVESDVSQAPSNVETYVNNNEPAIENDITQPQSVDTYVGQ